MYFDFRAYQIWTRITLHFNARATACSFICVFNNYCALSFVLQFKYCVLKTCKTRRRIKKNITAIFGDEKKKKEDFAMVKLIEVLQEQITSQDRRYIKQQELEIQFNPEAKPIFCKPRSIPFAVNKGI